MKNRLRATAGAIAVLHLAIAVCAQQAELSAPASSSLSGAYLLDDAIAAVNDYLTTKKVVIIADPERGVIRTQDTMSPQNMANLARDATADSVLLISVDRPVASWIKLTVGAYDLSGSKLWEESASYGGGMNGKSAVNKTMEKLQPKLDAHLAKPGLPVKG
jgi:hypothetical protein